MAIQTRELDMSECTHDGIHGPDSEPGAVQRCHEETILVRAQQSPEGKDVNDAMTRLEDELLPAYHIRLVREAMRLAASEGTLADLVLEPADDYGRSKPWDPER